MADPCDSIQNDYDLLVQTTSDGALILDGSGLLIRINHAAGSMLRCVAHDCIGKRPSAAFPDQPALLALLASVAAGDGEVVRRISLPDKRIAQGIAIQQSDGGRMILLRDIT